MAVSRSSHPAPEKVPPEQTCPERACQERACQEPSSAPLVIQEVSLAWEARLRSILDARFQRYVRVLHGPPSRERVGGKLPAMAVQLLEIQLTETARLGRRRAEASAPAPGPGLRGLRVDYLFSAWAESPLDEQLLLDALRVDLDLERRLVVTTGSGPDGGPTRTYPVTPRSCLKVEHAVSLWSAMGWPVHASLTYGVNIKAG